MTLSLPVRSHALQALQHSSHPSLRKLSVEETEDSLVIKGSVSSYYLKQLAQETLMPVRGERELVNQVKVVRH